LVFGNVAEVDPDARPGAGASAHRVHEDVIHLQEGGGFRMPCSPAFETCECVVFMLSLRDRDERLCRLAATAAFLCGARGLPSRRGDTRWLAGLLLVVGGPRRIPEAGGFLSSGQVEKLVE
jgi:hypothetical protein